jgi:predicted transglutaminase-like cysteine proteinase
MPIGAPVAAPAGFLDLCERSPSDCSHSGVYNPEKIRTLARAALVERYKLAFAALRAGHRLDDGAYQQAAAVAVAAQAHEAPAASDSVHYLTWPSQTGAETPLSYAQPLSSPGIQPSGASRAFLPGLATPAAKSYISDFLDLSIDGHAWPELGGLSATASTRLSLAAGDVQPGAILPDDGVRLNWANKGDDDTAYAAAAPVAVTPVSSAMVEAPSIQYDLPQAPYDWAHLRMAAPSDEQASRGETGVTATAMTDTTTEPSDYLRIDMRGDTARIVRTVNDEVNRVMRGATDEVVYHVADYWNAPDLAPGVRGDCEDYALEKRRLLIQYGIPAAALSIAIVRTRLGDDHAVLVVSSRQGDFVLDNLQYDVRLWRKAGYDWISRQGPGDDLGWVSLEPANSSASPWQARTVRIAYRQ